MSWVGWRCTRCGHEMHDDPRWCPQCGWTVYEPIHDHERPEWRAASEDTPTESARHVAELTAALKRIDWQGGTNYGSQWLAGALYDDGIRVQLPPHQADPEPEAIRPTGRQGRGA